MVTLTAVDVVMAYLLKMQILCRKISGNGRRVSAVVFSFTGIGDGAGQSAALGARDRAKAFRKAADASSTACRPLSTTAPMLKKPWIIPS